MSNINRSQAVDLLACAMEEITNAEESDSSIRAIFKAGVAYGLAKAADIVPLSDGALKYINDFADMKNLARETARKAASTDIDL